MVENEADAENCVKDFRFFVFWRFLNANTSRFWNMIFLKFDIQHRKTTANTLKPLTYMGKPPKLTKTTKKTGKNGKKRKNCRNFVSGFVMFFGGGV